MITIETTSFIPIYEQIKNGIKGKISLGVLKANEPLPSIRDLAAELVVNPNTVARAYRDLESEGFITTRKGKASFVTENSSSLIKQERQRFIDEVFERAISEARKFGLGEEEIRDIVEARLKARGKSGRGEGR
ncbi:MAG: GntR family transcriptional regulator [Candidatus Aminicenantes bacterium]|nr:GntR family transcriptional regulator [Candidatus Aminicenantes bacterium]